MAEVQMQESRVRITGPLVSMVAAATSYVLHTLGLGKRAVIKKLMVYNGQPANVQVVIGFTTLAAVWTPCLPPFTAITVFDNEWFEDDIPIRGNTPIGFMADTTALTGTLGDIIGRASAAAAAPADVQVQVEVEEIG